jgi:hypothetical protein
MEVGLDEPHTIESEALRRRSPESQRSARQIRANHHTIRPCQIQAHLSGPAPDLDDPRIAGDGLVEQTREFAPLRSRSQGRQTIARRIAREWSLLIEMANDVGAGVAVHAQVRNPVRRFVSRPALATRPIRCERASARGASE